MTFGLAFCATGTSSTITLGTITTENLSPSSSALVTVTNSGTINYAILNMKFQIPQGKDGTNGTNGTDGKNETDGKDGKDGTDANYATVAAMIAANDVVITAAYALAISSAITAATTPLSTAIGVLTDTIAALTIRVTALETKLQI
jgi:hypothetical protein